MKMVRSVIVLIFLFALVFGNSFAQSDWNGTLAAISFAWPNDDVQASKLTKQQVNALLKSISAVRNGQGSDAWKDVESYRFVGLNDNRLYLIAVTDDSPAKWFQDIEVVRCDGTNCTWSLIHSEPPNDLNKQIMDLKKNGTHQVLAKESIFGGKHEGGDLLYVYGASTGKVADESTKYPDFYISKVIPGLDRKMREITPDKLNTQDMIDKRRAELLL